VKAFGKSESYAPTLKHCRIICSPSDAFKTVWGPACKDIEERVYASKHFIKHIPVPERPAFLKEMERNGRKYYITDYTAFESHMRDSVMESIECVVYRYFLTNFPELAETVCKSITGTNAIRFSSGLKCKVKGRRMSGEMSTSLGNGLTNLFLALYVLHEKGVPYETIDLAVEGDDGQLCVPKEVDLSTKDFENLGFTIKLEEVSAPGVGKPGVAFCGMNSIDGQNVRELIPFISKFAWTLNEPGASSKRRSSLLVAKALSAIYETPQCPIISVIARQALAMYPGVAPLFISDGYHTSNVPTEISTFNPTSGVRHGFEQLTGISVQQQLEYERRIVADGNLSCLRDLPTSSLPNTAFTDAVRLRYWGGWVT